MRLNGKVALVSGGASGMGQSEALIFAREGARAVVADVLETDGRQEAALRIMTKTAAVQYAKDGIRVNSVHPGMMPPMRSSKTSADPVWRDKMIKAVPMKRAGRVEEVAHAVLFLASDEASYITGTELVVDGGYLAV